MDHKNKGFVGQAGVMKRIQVTKLCQQYNYQGNSIYKYSVKTASTDDDSRKRKAYCTFTI